MKRITLLLIIIITVFASYAQVPIVHYTFNGNMADSMGNAPSFTTTGTVTAVDDHVGRTNGAYRFNNSYIEIGSSSATNTASMPKHTITTWVKLNGESTVDGRIMCLDDDINKVAYEIVYNITSNQFVFKNYYNSTEYDITAPNTVVSGKWYHLAVTLNTITDSTKFYVDGTLATQTGLQIAAPLYPTLHLGTNFKFPWYFLGDMGEFSIYTQELTATQIYNMAQNQPINLNNRQAQTTALTVNNYPNPVTNGSFELELPGIYGPTSCAIFDVYGRVLITEKFESAPALKKILNVNTLQPGTYFMYIMTPNGDVQRKFLIQQP